MRMKTFIYQESSVKFFKTKEKVEVIFSNVFFFFRRKHCNYKLVKFLLSVMQEVLEAEEVFWTAALARELVWKNAIQESGNLRTTITVAILSFAAL